MLFIVWNDTDHDDEEEEAADLGGGGGGGGGEPHHRNPRSMLRVKAKVLKHFGAQ